ncbi:spore coat associated protein CotJA [Paenibacillus sp. GCM10012303]|uniref:spore coat associated protein CotJA n=1 Tax=Paenibacillus sp. GCM10012303 TaxID=3317340 RepID=UPI0036D23A07
MHSPAQHSPAQHSQWRVYYPFVGPCDPCPPILKKWFVIPPNVTMPVQPPGLPQFTPQEALRAGTLWPAYYSPYNGRRG